MDVLVLLCYKRWKGKNCSSCEYCKLKWRYSAVDISIRLAAFLNISASDIVWGSVWLVSNNYFRGITLRYLTEWIYISKRWILTLFYQNMEFLSTWPGWWTTYLTYCYTSIRYRNFNEWYPRKACVFLPI